MKSYSKLSFLALALSLAFSPVLVRAQDSTPPPPPADGAGAPPDGAPKKHGGRGNPVAMLTEKLGLTADQQAKVTAIWKDSQTQMKALRADTSLSDDDRRAKMGALMKSQHDQIRAVLTPEQQTTFDTLPKPGERRKKQDAN